MNATSSLAFAQRTKSPTISAQKDRLPSINYALYTETSLRKKLKELGIPNHGNKELMRKRHTEWVNLWNANCDSSRPKPKRDLLRELETWERTLGRQIEKSTGSTGVMVKDFDRDGWAKTQKGEFDDLIRKAREKRKAAVSSEQKDEGQDTNMEDAGSNLENNAQQTDVSEQQNMDSSDMQTQGSVTLNRPVDDGSNDDKHPQPQDAHKESQAEMNGVPEIPQNEHHEGPIDLASSPAAAAPVNSSQQMPDKQKSKFFV